MYILFFSSRLSLPLGIPDDWALAIASIDDVVSGCRFRGGATAERKWFTEPHPALLSESKESHHELNRPIFSSFPLSLSLSFSMFFCSHFLSGAYLLPSQSCTQFLLKRASWISLQFTAAFFFFFVWNRSNLLNHRVRWSVKKRLFADEMHPLSMKTTEMLLHTRHSMFSSIKCWFLSGGLTKWKAMKRNGNDSGAFACNLNTVQRNLPKMIGIEWNATIGHGWTRNLLLIFFRWPIVFFGCSFAEPAVCRHRLRHLEASDDQKFPFVEERRVHDRFPQQTQVNFRVSFSPTLFLGSTVQPPWKSSVTIVWIVVDYAVWVGELIGSLVLTLILH